MRLVFLGNDPWSVPPLEALVARRGFDVPVVITNPPRRAGRGSRLIPTAVADAARRLGLRVIEVDSVRQGAGFNAIGQAKSDAMVVVAYGELLSSEVLALARLGAVNIHFSLLPRWRGASPVQHALLAGDRRTGVTLIQMDRGLDSGPILATATEAVLATDDAGSLGARLSRAGAELVSQTLPGYVSGALKPRPQADDGVTHAPKLGPADRLIEWDQSAQTVLARVRALSPSPGARTSFRGETLKVLVVEISTSTSSPTTFEPGTVVSVDDQGTLIAAGSGCVRLVLVAPQGRKHMSGADWVRGTRIRPGERFG